MKTMNPVAIIGAGITGLVVAYRLRQMGLPVVVYEAGDRVGGVIQSVRRDGYLAECGPNTILETSSKVAELVRDLGLEPRRLYADPAAKNRYIVRRNRLRKLPSSLLGFMATPLFSPAARLRFLAEPFVRPAPEAREESVAQFVGRRLGREFLDHAMDALVSGIYAGDLEKLSLPHAFPELRAIEQRHGSLTKGQMLGEVEPNPGQEVAKPIAPKFSFDEGLQVLTDTLYSQLHPVVRLQSPVIKLAQTPFGWAVTTRAASGESRQDHAAVLYAGTAFRLPEMQIATERYINWSSFAEIQYPSVASVMLGFPREAVAHPLDGFGLLVPRGESLSILGTLFSSSLFSNRAPAGYVTLTSYLGGARSPELAKRGADELFELTSADLRRLLGITGEPSFKHHTFVPRAIPQYDVGFGRFRTLMNEIEAKAPRLFLAGQYRDGTSLADSILSAHHAAERIHDCLLSGQRTNKVADHLTCQL